MGIPLIRKLRIGRTCGGDIRCDVDFGRAKIQCSLGNSRRLGVIRTADLLAFYKKFTMPVIQTAIAARLSPICPSEAETEITVKMNTAASGRIHHTTSRLPPRLSALVPVVREPRTARSNLPVPARPNDPQTEQPWVQAQG